MRNRAFYPLSWFAIPDRISWRRQSAREKLSGDIKSIPPSLGGSMPEEGSQSRKADGLEGIYLHRRMKAPSLCLG